MYSDLDILQKYDQSRDPDAFNQLVARHGAMVYAAAFRVTRNAADADDVTQECFLELVRQAARVRTSVAGWLHLTATHRARDLLRRSSAHQRAVSAVEPPHTDLDQAAWSEIAPLLDQVLAELPDELRLPLIGHYLEGRTQGEIAEELGISRPTVNRRIEEGLQELRRSLRQGGAAEASGMGMLLMGMGQMSLPATVKVGLTKIALAGMGTSLATMGKTTSLGAAHAAPGISIGMALTTFVLIGGAAVMGWATLRPSAPVPAMHVTTDITAPQHPDPIPSSTRPVTGTWRNVTPNSLRLSPSLPAIGDNYGVQDVLADPAHPGTFYAFACYEGCWKSIDWGMTWNHESRDGQLEHGRPWSDAIAPDGSYLLACTGGYRRHDGGAWKSIDGGKTWRTVGIAGNDDDAYSIDIDRLDRNHVIAAIPDGERIFESWDTGESWRERTSAHMGRGGYLFFITSTTWLAVGQEGEHKGTLRTLDSGSTWSSVGPMEHLTGQEQIVIDQTSHDIYVPTRHGIFRSADGAASFGIVSPVGASTVFATENHLYAFFAWASQGSIHPAPQSATRHNGQDWKAMPDTAGMTNGAKRIAVARNPATGEWIAVSGNWLSGIWQFTEH